jgi:hypothetical protein
MKLNACNKYKESNKALLEGLKAKGWEIDRFGHAKRETDGKLYRYKFQHHTIRFEVQVVHAADRYIPESREWVRIKTLKYTAKVK